MGRAGPKACPPPQEQPATPLGRARAAGGPPVDGDFIPRQTQSTLSLGMCAGQEMMGVEAWYLLEQHRGGSDPSFPSREAWGSRFGQQPWPKAFWDSPWVGAKLGPCSGVG